MRRRFDKDVSQPSLRYSARRLLDQVGPMGQKIKLDAALLRLPIPLHPGAARYYAELGKAPVGTSN